MKSLLVIDGDNISPTTFSSGWNNLERDTICEKVLFGDFAKTEMVKWQKFAVENNIELHHCPRNNKKQTTDLNIFIDVMTKLYESNFDELFMVTNDSDFILLANAWIKRNKKVTFISSNNCSTLIKNNFNVIMLETKKTKDKNQKKAEIISDIQDTLQNIIENDIENIKSKKDKPLEKKTTENISVKLYEFITKNPETSILEISLFLEQFYGKVKPKRVKKLLIKMDSEYLWILEDEKCFDNSK